jgi:hypothetical protein
MFIKYKKTVQYINIIQGQGKGKGINGPGVTSINTNLKGIQ